MSGGGKTLWDTWGDERQAMLARLEYGLSPWDERVAIEFVEPRETCSRCHRKMGAHTARVTTEEGVRHERDCLDQTSHLERMGL